MNSTPKALRYLVGGLAIGGFWYLNRSRPAWEEALRTILVFGVLMVVLRAKLRRKGVEVHLVPLIASKGALVVAAALVETAIASSLADPVLPVAIGLGLVVAALGPLGDGHYFTRPQAAAGPAVR